LTNPETSPNRSRLSKRRIEFGVVGLVLFVAAYATSIALYIKGGEGHPNVIVSGPSGGNATKIVVDVAEVQSATSVVVVNVNVVPGAALLDQQGNLKEDLRIRVTSATANGYKKWDRGTVPDVQRVSVALTGEVAKWPFDHYRSGPLVIELTSGIYNVPASVSLIDRLLGWEIETKRVNEIDQHGPYLVELERSPSTVAIAVIILGVLIALAGVALFVALQTARDKRKFQPPMTTWYAGMLFAVMPLRNALPDAPPFGSWVDILIVSWVIATLAVSMVIYISCWWRHTRPAPGESVVPA
jgi:hypothetical protein